MTAIPWQEPARFREACSFFSAMDKARPHAFDRVRDAAARIAGLISSLDPGMTAMCRVTCPDCRDNCCARATIWYDFTDLLFLYFNGFPMPERQIGRQKGDGPPLCTHLTPAGCTLQRACRPFVCTWYLCEDQKKIPGAGRVLADILRIQALRREMEDAFCRACL